MRLSFIAIPALVLAVAVVGAVATGVAGPPTWYGEIARPPGTPPAWVFGPVWTILYILIADALLGGWVRLRGTEMRRYAAGVAGVNLVANAGWSFLFFNQQAFVLAAADAVLIAASAWLLVYLLWRRVHTASLALLPYALWSTYAAYLAAGFVAYNSF